MLPDPGGPIVRARSGFEDILDKWIWRACLMKLQRPNRIEWRRRAECIFSSKGWFYGQDAIDWELQTLRWQNMQRAHVFLHVFDSIWRTQNIRKGIKFNFNLMQDFSLLLVF